MKAMVIAAMFLATVYGIRGTNTKMVLVYKHFRSICLVCGLRDFDAKRSIIERRKAGLGEDFIYSDQTG